MPRTRLSVAGYVVLVFLSGAVMGSIATRLYLVPSVASTTPPRPEEWRKRYVEEVRSRVKLDGQQVARLQQILDETRQRFHQLRDEEKPRVDAIQAEQTEKIRAMLRDDQRDAYEQLRLERERRRNEADRKKGPPKF